MKRLLFLILPILLFASCQPNYNNKIIFRKVSTISCSFTPTITMQGAIDSGFVNVNTKAAGNPLICDSIYTVAFTTYEKWHYGYTGFLWWGIAVLVIGEGIYAWLTSTGTDGYWTLGVAFGALLIGGFLIGGFYYFNESRDIKKSDYVHYIQKDGDLRNFPLDPAQTL